MLYHQLFLVDLYCLVSSISFNDLSKIDSDAQHVVAERLEVLEDYLRKYLLATAKFDSLERR